MLLIEKINVLFIKVFVILSRVAHGPGTNDVALKCTMGHIFTLFPAQLCALGRHYQVKENMNVL